MLNSRTSSLIEKLKKRKQCLAAAESCTGGGLLKELTDVPGSSNVIWGGVIAYSNEAKISMLKVPQSLLESAGAVSAEVAEAMAKGVKKHSGAHWSIAVTGIAGPDGGSPEKPVGTVWITWCNPQDIAENAFFCFEGNREAVRNQTIEVALNGLESRLDSP